MKLASQNRDLRKYTRCGKQIFNKLVYRQFALPPISFESTVPPGRYAGSCAGNQLQVLHLVYGLHIRRDWISPSVVVLSRW